MLILTRSAVITRFREVSHWTFLYNVFPKKGGANWSIKKRSYSKNQNKLYVNTYQEHRHHQVHGGCPMDFPLLISEKEFIISIKEKDEILLRSNHLNKRQQQLWEKIGFWEWVHRQHQVQAGWLTNLPFHHFYELRCAKKNVIWIKF